MEPIDKFYDNTGKFAKYVISDKSTIPDLVIYNKTFNKYDCFYQYEGGEFCKFPRKKFKISTKAHRSSTKKIFEELKEINEEVKVSDFNENNIGNDEKTKEKEKIEDNTKDDTKQKAKVEENNSTKHNENEEIKVDDKNYGLSKTDNTVQKDEFAEENNNTNSGEQDNNTKNQQTELLNENNKENLEENDEEDDEIYTNPLQFLRQIERNTSEHLIEENVIQVKKEVEEFKVEGKTTESEKGKKEHKKKRRKKKTEDEKIESGKEENIINKESINSDNIKFDNKNNTETEENKNKFIEINDVIKPEEKEKIISISENNKEKKVIDSIGNENSKIQETKISNTNINININNTTNNIINKPNINPAIPVQLPLSPQQTPLIHAFIPTMPVNTIQYPMMYNMGMIGMMNQMNALNLMKMNQIHQMNQLHQQMNPMLFHHMPQMNTNMNINQPDDDIANLDPMLKDETLDLNSVSNQIFLEKPALLIKKNLSDPKWFIMKNNKINGVYNSEELLYYLFSEIQKGNKFDDVMVNEHFTDISFRPEDLFHTLKKTVPALKKLHIKKMMAGTQQHNMQLMNQVNQLKIKNMTENQKMAGNKNTGFNKGGFKYNNNFGYNGYNMNNYNKFNKVNKK